MSAVTTLADAVLEPSKCALLSRGAEVVARAQVTLGCRTALELIYDNKVVYMYNARTAVQNGTLLQWDAHGVNFTLEHVKLEKQQILMCT